MEELISRIGQMLDQKLEEKLNEKLQALEQRLEIKLEQKLDEKIQASEQRLEVKLEKRLEQKFDKKLENLKKELLDQYFMFEQNYGTKIDAILDAVSLELDKNLEKSEKIRKIDSRMDRGEVAIFGLEKRVSVLEMK